MHIFSSYMVVFPTGGVVHLKIMLLEMTANASPHLKVYSKVFAQGGTFCSQEMEMGGIRRCIGFPRNFSRKWIELLLRFIGYGAN